MKKVNYAYVDAHDSINIKSNLYRDLLTIIFQVMRQNYSSMY